MREAWLEPGSLTAATAIQREIADRCVVADRPLAGGIAGADTSCKWRDSRGPIHAAIAGEAETATLTVLPPFPYVPGYLGFREVPALVAAWRQLAAKPGLILVDGQGRAHPRRAGIATHLGVILDVPTIGVAKSLLCGVPAGALGEDVGDAVPVIDRGETVAMAVRTRRRALPLIVSVGHRVTLATAVATVLNLTGGRRQPAPVRRAHDAANAQRRRSESAALPG